MSQENVEIARRSLALLSQGDEAAWDEMPPEFVFDFSRRLIDPVVLRGRDEMRAWILTGTGAETSPRRFLPQHAAHLALFVASSLATASVLSIALGAVLMNYMSLYVA